MKLGRIVAHKNTQVFPKTSRKQTVQGEYFMNERQPNSSEHKDRSGWQPWHSVAVTDVAFHSTHRKGYQSKLLFFHSKAAVVVPEACFTAMTEDRHDEQTSMELSVIAVALTTAWLVWISTVIPIWLYFPYSCFVLFCFWSRNFTYYKKVSCVWFLLLYISLQSN